MNKASGGDGIPVELFQILKDDAVKVPHSVPPTLQQATTNPRLCWRLLDTHRQVWVSLLWDHCSFLLSMTKASGGDGIPVELFQILKDDAVKVLHSICQQIWKTQQWLQDWKRSVFIPIPKKRNAKEFSNYHKLHSSHMLVK